jgi:EmrB/QacA subfamily drug resistance transporter
MAAHRGVRRTGSSFVVVVLASSLPMFMATLDNLVVTFALPEIRRDLGASLQLLQWVVNAYTLAFATLLMTMSALGDRLGRRRVFVGGTVMFTVASAAAALVEGPTALIAARAVQGVAAAAVMPLSLTLLTDQVPAGRRAAGIGIWGGVSGLGVALGPLVGGLVTNGLDWRWIFWLNVPVGVVTVPLVLLALRESRGPDRSLDLLGMVLAGTGVFAVAWAIVGTDTNGWATASRAGVLACGVLLLVAFVGWQRRGPAPLLPLRLFRSRGFSAANAASVAFYFGIFGSVFLLAQFFQVVQGLSPLQAAVRTLPWTMAPMLVAPWTGLLTARLGSRTVVVTGLVFQLTALGWIASVLATDVTYPVLLVPFLLAGAGLGLTLAPLANVIMSTVADVDHGKASGINSTLSEIGVALGVAVLTAVFVANGSYASGSSFVHGLVPAVYVGMAFVMIGAVTALALPGRPDSARDGVTDGSDETATGAGPRPVGARR